MIINLNNNPDENAAGAENIEELQKETLVSVAEYTVNLSRGMNNVIMELEGEMKEDTWEYLRMILDGFNWVAEAYNGTSSILKANGYEFDNDAIDTSVKVISKSFSAKDNAAIALELKNVILPFVEKLGEAASKIQ